MAPGIVWACFFGVTSALVLVSKHLRVIVYLILSWVVEPWDGFGGAHSLLGVWRSHKTVSRGGKVEQRAQNEAGELGKGRLLQGFIARGI